MSKKDHRIIIPKTQALHTSAREVTSSSVVSLPILRLIFGNSGARSNVLGMVVLIAGKI